MTAATETPGAAAPRAAEAKIMKLAGMTLEELRQKYHHELFGRMLPFWDKHGIDHQHGGVFHCLDYDGTRVDTTKLSWFQGRAIWVYSFLYNEFGKNPAWLEIARKTKEFLLRHAPQPDGWWAEALSREGTVARPFRGDIYGMYFAAEGLQEYAWAAGDGEARDMALALMKRLHGYINQSGFRFMGAGAPGQRAQGLWMVNLNIARQMLPRWKDPEIQAIADQAVDAVVKRHYNPEIGLNNEMLNFDFSRPAEEQSKSLLGHSIETLWMVQEEALRRGDTALWDTCAARIRKHLEVGWDWVYGGLSQWINVDHGGYEWPVETPIGTNLEFRFIGEFHYMKALWALNEVLVATLYILEQTGDDWAARFFELAHNCIEDRFSMRRRGLPGYGLFGGRRMEFPEHTARQDNYHPPRQLMLNLLTLDRMIKRGGKPVRPV
jgi:mannose/cellobiose epimerase-like protein (N-acyl-D-glucosamine 2-epimerase family)